MELLTVTGLGAYYLEDLAALQRHPQFPADRYHTPSNTPGMRHLRDVAEVLSVGIRAADGRTHWGDCLGVSYGGKSGRDGVFCAATVDTEIRLRQLELLTAISGNFRQSCQRLCELGVSRPLLFGLSQAVLRHVSYVKGLTPLEILCAEWELPLPKIPIPLHGSCGYDWYDNVDKMLAYQLPSLPAGQGDDIPNKLGEGGERFLEYVGWLKKRCRVFGDYRPTFHFDLHGALNILFDRQLESIVEFLGRLREACSPHSLRIESPMTEVRLEDQVERYCLLKERLFQSGVAIDLVVDEWANTLDDIRVFLTAKAVDMVHIKMPDLGALDASMDAVLLCQKHGVGSLLGGSCVETYLSAELAIPVALAARPSLLMAKSGMGVNEAVSSFHNGMRRALCQLPI